MVSGGGFSHPEAAASSIPKLPLQSQHPLPGSAINYPETRAPEDSYSITVPAIGIAADNQILTDIPDAIDVHPQPVDRDVV